MRQKITEILGKFLLVPTLGIFAFSAPFVSHSAQADEEENWILVWSDEFAGSEIDFSKWTHEVNAWGGGNNELQYYTAREENSFINDENQLVIRAIRETFTGPEGTRQYTSARLNTSGKGDFLYGKIEVRAKMPIGQGLWPAIWMLPTDWDYGSWAASGEIDIMEYRGNLPEEVVFSLHYGDNWPNNQYSSATFDSPNLSENFHVYGIEWDPDEIRWYFDGVHMHTIDNWWSTGGAFPAPFDRRFHILLNVAVGGNFLPNPPADADYFPQEMTVDWVRVYKKPGTPFGGERAQVPGLIQAERYDEGGPGIAYYDRTMTNEGGQFRPDDDVGIEECEDEGGGFNIGWLEPGEWLEYSIESTTNQPMRIDVRNASQGNSGQMRLIIRDEAGEIQYSHVFDFLPTGGWQNWETDEGPEVSLEPGNYVIRLEIFQGDFNLNYLEFVPLTTDAGIDSFWIY